MAVQLVDLHICFPHQNRADDDLIRSIPDVGQRKRRIHADVMLFQSEYLRKIILLPENRLWKKLLVFCLFAHFRHFCSVLSFFLI